MYSPTVVKSLGYEKEKLFDALFGANKSGSTILKHKHVLPNRNFGFQKSFPPSNLEHFVEWAQSIYLEYSRIYSTDANILEMHKKHRTMIVGLHACCILNKSGWRVVLGLTALSALDPLEFKKLNGEIHLLKLDINGTLERQIFHIRWVSTCARTLKKLT